MPPVVRGPRSGGGGTGVDVAVVGSGPNGLAAAITAAAAGLRVVVLEAAGAPGGGLRTETLTLPGFRHDVCSAIHPLGPGSPFLRALPLARHGLAWIHPEVAFAHPLDDGPAVGVGRDLDATANGLGVDGSTYRGVFGPLARAWDRASLALLSPVGPATPWSLPGAGLPGVGPASRLAAGFATERGRAVIAGLAAHAILPLDRAPSAGVAWTLGAAAHAVGWPLPAGGAASLARALVSILDKLDGEVRCGRPVRSLLDVPPARATLLDLGPGPAARVLKEALSARTRRAWTAYAYGPGAFKLDWALSDPIPWADATCARAGTVHLGGAWEEIARSERAAWTGAPCDRPYVLLTQPSRFDASRAPDGAHVGWAYCHVPSGSERDMTDAVERQVERFAPGFGDCILSRSVLRPADLEHRNPNLVGGDVGGGALTPRRLLGGPGGPRRPYGTGIPGVFLCSSSTPPGAGVHGMCGFHAARAALADRFGLRLPVDPGAWLADALRARIPA